MAITIRESDLFIPTRAQRPAAPSPHVDSVERGRPRDSATVRTVALALLALSMAVAIGVAAFALGAGSRPSRAEVSNDLMNQRQQLQADADRRATQQEQALRSEFAQTLDATVRHATQRGVARGRRLGFAAGRAQGYGSGHAAGYAAGINAGYSSGQAVGESLGFARGYCASFGPIC